MIFLPIIAIVVGALIMMVPGLHTPFHTNANYWAVACIAGIDTICGGYRSGMEGKFRNDVFFSGFISNILIAFGLSWLGDKIGVNLYLVAALVMGQRIFVNLSLIRRIFLTKWQDRVARNKQREEASQGVAANQSSEVSRT